MYTALSGAAVPVGFAELRLSTVRKGSTGHRDEPEDTDGAAHPDGGHSQAWNRAQTSPELWAERWRSLAVLREHKHTESSGTTQRSAGLH